MSEELAQEAIELALAGNFSKAIEINLKILKEDSKNVDALNRLARAYSEIGKIPLAKKTSSKVLKIDPFNPIATKSIAKWSEIKKGRSFSSAYSKAETFLEEPGKTKVVSLLHLGDSKILVKLDAGDVVELDFHSHRIGVTTLEGKYVGRLPDDLSSRIKKLVSLGNQYRAYIKSADKKEVRVFMREVARSPKLVDVPSFPTEKIDYVSFTPPELVHDKREIETPEEEE